ncbi:unnamed protein product, partial [Ilex paraguariensis]
ALSQETEKTVRLEGTSRIESAMHERRALDARSLDVLGGVTASTKVRARKRARRQGCADERGGRKTIG